MDRSKRMGEGSIPRLLLTFSAPAIVGMLAQALYNVVDRVFIGRAVGHLGIAGIAVSFPFMLILMAIGKPKHAMFLSLSRQVLLLIPAVRILPLWFGLDGVWAAMPTADLGSSLLTGFSRQSREAFPLATA